MTTHAGHDHENTKAARAKCRRDNADPSSPMAEKVRDRPIPSPKKSKASKRQAACKHPKPYTWVTFQEGDEKREQEICGKCGTIMDEAICRHPHTLMNRCIDCDAEDILASA